jgi:phosphopantothenoylcysteine decarboxylase / phosphopantothenate---cysteine ligase
MRFLITAGGTREYIDPVRFISNASSGRMGFCAAFAAIRSGHKVTVITAPTNQHVPAGTKIIKVETAEQMFNAVKKHFEKCDCLIMAAAVADYVPVKSAKTKIKKTGKLLTITLKPTTDILKWAGQHKKEQILVGFALEDKNIRMRAEKKLKDKNLDMIIANSIATIGSATASVEIKMPGCKWIKLAPKSKNIIAGKIVLLVEDISQNHLIC